MTRSSLCVAVALLLSACASSEPARAPSAVPASSTAPAAAASVSWPAASRSSVTFDSNFAFDIRPMAAFAPLMQRIGPPSTHAGTNTYHWSGAEGSELDVETLGDRIHRATVTTPDGSHLIIEPEVAGQNALSQSKAAAGAIKRSAVAAVQRWAQAWSSQNVDAYLRCYASDFHAAGMTRAQWIAQRRQRIQSAHNINVQLSALRVEPIGDTRVRVNFLQRYSASNHRDSTGKKLDLWLLEGDWRIVGEAAD